MSRRLSWMFLPLAVCAILTGKVWAQGYSFLAPFPQITKNASTGLQVNYSAGKLAVGGLIQAIVAGNVTVTNTETNCQWPVYSACNFIYWPGSGTSLSTSTSYASAFAPGNLVLAFVTATGGNITLITPATINPIQPGSLGTYWVSPGQCTSFVSANSTGTNGLTTVGASNTQVQQASTSGSGTNTHTYQCNISPPTRWTQIVDATFFYGVQTASLGTQAVVLASGTLNGQIVFTSITHPAAGASETPSTVTPVRADAGTLTMTPVAASFNTSTTTSGAFFSAYFLPASPILINTDLEQVFLNVTVQMAATTAMITNSPGVIVRYTK